MAFDHLVQSGLITLVEFFRHDVGIRFAQGLDVRPRVCSGILGSGPADLILGQRDGHASMLLTYDGDGEPVPALRTNRLDRRRIEPGVASEQFEGFTGAADILVFDTSCSSTSRSSAGF